MEGESLILRFRDFNGREIPVETLKEYRASVQQYLDYIGHGPYVADLRDILKRMAIALNIASKERANYMVITIKPTQVKEEPTPAPVPTLSGIKLPKTVSAKEIRAIVKEELKTIRPKETVGQKLSKVKPEGKKKLAKKVLTKNVKKGEGLKGTDLNKLRHYIEGYLLIEGEKNKLIEKLELHNSPDDLKERQKIEKQIEEKENWLDIQVEQSAKHLKITPLEFIGRVNNFSENNRSLKDQSDFVIDKKKGKVKIEPIPAPVEKPAEVKPKSLSGVDYDYKEVDLGPYQKDFHRMYSDTIVQIHGMPGHGKTVWLLKYAQSRAERGEHVLYVAREEHGRSVFDIKLKENNIGHANLRFKRELTKDDMQWATVIILDSVTALKLNHEDVEQLSLDYPNRNWYVVLQSTKDGDFRGSNEWEHLVDVAGEIRNRTLILNKNRLDKDNAAKREKLQTESAIEEAKKKFEIKEAVKASLKPEVKQPGTGQPETGNQIAA